MALTTDFDYKEILSAGKLDTLVAAINSALAALGTSNIGWPLVAGGNIDMDGDYTIDNMKQFWGIRNAKEYASANVYDSTAFQACGDDLETDGGGCLFIPPDTTFTIKDIEINASGSKPFLILGCGKSSILQMDSSPTSDMIDFLAGSTDVEICNLQIDGASQGTGKKGLIFRDCVGVKIHDVWIKDFTGDFITFTNTGSAGNPCENVQMWNVLLEGGSGTADHIFADDLDTADFSHIISKDAAGCGISFDASAQTAIMRDINIADVTVDTPGDHGISVIGQTAPADATHARVSISDCKVLAPVGVGIELGTTGAMIQYADISDCRIISPGVDAFTINITTGSVTGCKVYDADDSSTYDGITLNASTGVRVDGCDLYGSSGAYAIDCGTSDACVLTNNNVTGTWTEGIYRDSATDLVVENNPGSHCPSIDNIHAAAGDWSTTDTADYATLTSYTVPANTIKNGDCIRVTVAGVAGNAIGYLEVTADGNDMGQMQIGASAHGGGVWLMYIDDIDKGSENTYAAMRGIEGGGGDWAGDNAATIDWTGDIVIAIKGKVASGTAMHVYRYFVEFLGGI